MAHLSYRGRRSMKKLVRFALVALVLLIVVALLLLLYLEPYVVYDREGAHLNYPFEEEEDDAAQVTPTTPRPVISDPQIIYGGTASVQESLADLDGYYITTDMLREPEKTLEALKALTGPCAVMVELKSVFGNFYYNSKIPGASIADEDIVAGAATVLDYLRSGNFYLVAEIPAFADSAFALANQSCGLPLSSGALWVDSRGCYWLDPANTGVINYLTQIGQELVTLGFNEVAFSEFYFPDSSNIVYSSAQTPAEILGDAISQLTAALAPTGITVSFVTEDLDFPATACTGRLYLPNLSGTQIGQYVQNFGSATGLQELVFLVNSKDSRFGEQATMRPLT